MPTPAINTAVIEPLMPVVSTVMPTQTDSQAQRNRNLSFSSFSLTQPQPVPDIIQSAPQPATLTEVTFQPPTGPVLPDIHQMESQLLNSGQLLSDIPISTENNSVLSHLQPGVSPEAAKPQAGLTAINTPLTIANPITLATTAVQRPDTYAGAEESGSSWGHRILVAAITALTILTMVALGSMMMQENRAADQLIPETPTDLGYSEQVPGLSAE